MFTKNVFKHFAKFSSRTLLCSLSRIVERNSSFNLFELQRNNFRRSFLKLETDFVVTGDLLRKIHPMRSCKLIIASFLIFTFMFLQMYTVISKVKRRLQIYLRCLFLFILSLHKFGIRRYCYSYKRLVNPCAWSPVIFPRVFLQHRLYPLDYFLIDLHHIRHLLFGIINRCCY